MTWCEKRSSTLSPFWIPGALLLLPLVSFGAGPPLSFEPNLGQAPTEVRYIARPAGQIASFMQSGVTFRLHGTAADAVVRMTFSGTRKLLPEPEDQLPGRINYLDSRQSNGRQTNIPTYSRLRYRDAWPGIDLVFYGNPSDLEYDLLLRPGADPANLRLRFEGADSVNLDSRGDLVIATAAGEIRQRKPSAYQLTTSGRRNIGIGYLLEGRGVVALRPASYDKSAKLVVDPVVSFSTFLGGSDLEDARAIAVDTQGNVYVTGTTASANFPITPGAANPSYTAGQIPGDVFVTKLDRGGTTVLYSTYLGGSRSDIGTAIAVDPTGAAYIGGYTNSLDFPVTSSVFQSTSRINGALPDGFVAKLNPDGSSLVYSTYLGQSGTDKINAIAVDASGDALVGGSTDSLSFPTSQGAVRSSCPGGGLHGFVTSLNPRGASLVYSTYLCGSANDEILAITVDSGGNAYVAGNTTSTDFPTTTGALRTRSTGDGNEAFVAKLNAAGTTLLYATYLGGAANDVATGIAADSQGNAYVAGYTRSDDFPATAGVFQARHGDRGLFEDAFVAVLNASGSGLVNSTYLGGSAADRATGIAINSTGIYLTGTTSSADFPGTRPRCQPGYAGRQDAFVAKLDLRAASLVYTTLLGGWENDLARAIAIDSSGSAYVAGQTASRNFTTTQGAYRTAYGAGYGGASDAFVARVDDRTAATAPCIALNGILNAGSFLPGSVSPGMIVSVFGDGLGPAQPVIFTPPGATGLVATSLAGARLLFDNIPAPMILTSTGQLNAIVPYEVEGRQSVRVQAEYQGVTTQEVIVPVSATQASIFSQNSSGQGAGAILNQDYSLNTPANGAAKGSVIQIFATGEGQTNPPGVSGKVAVGVLPKPQQSVSVQIAGILAPIQYAGAAPGLIEGLLQVNAVVPANAPSGRAVPLVLKVGDTSSPVGITVTIR